MFFRTKVTKWEGIGRRDHVIVKALGTDYVFSANRVFYPLPFGTGCEFRYLVNPYDRKTGYDNIQCMATDASVIAEYDIPLLSKVMTLNVFTSDDVTKALFTIYVSTEDFSYAWSHNVYPDYSWLIYCLKGGKEKRILVDISLDDIVLNYNLIYPLWIQWPVYVDPNEVIEPTKFIRVA